MNSQEISKMYTEKKLMTKVYKVSKVHKFGPILFGPLLPFVLLKLSLEVKSCQVKQPYCQPKCKLLFKSPGSTALLQYVHQSFFDRSFGPIRRPPPPSRYSSMASERLKGELVRRDLKSISERGEQMEM